MDTINKCFKCNENISEFEVMCEKCRRKDFNVDRFITYITVVAIIAIITILIVNLL